MHFTSINVSSLRLRLIDAIWSNSFNSFPFFLFCEARIGERILSPKKRVMHKDKKTVIQTWKKRKTPMYKKQSKEKLREMSCDVKTLSSHFLLSYGNRTEKEGENQLEFSSRPTKRRIWETASREDAGAGLYVCTVLFIDIRRRLRCHFEPFCHKKRKVVSSVFSLKIST